MFKLEIDTGNAAFDDDPSGEISRILTVVAEKVSYGQTKGATFDINGNRVGSWEVSA